MNILKTFKENLFRLAETLGEADSGIARFADVSEDELTMLKEDTASNDLLYKFCVSTDFKLSSIYSDKGFEIASLEDQYSTYPTNLKKMISRLFCRRLIKIHCAGSESQFKMLLKVNKLSQPLLSRIISGHSSFSAVEFNLVFEGMSSVINKQDCKQLLGKCIFSLVPNWNFIQLRKHFKVTYQALSDELKITPSAASNWGSASAVPIPEQYYKKLATIFGGFSKQEFMTIILNPSDYADRKCTLMSSQTKLIDPPTDELTEDYGCKLTKTPEKKKKKKNSKIKPDKSRNIQYDLTTNSENLATGLEVVPSLSADHQYAITDQMVIKMFNNLSPENKRKAVALITELFFSQI